MTALNKAFIKAYTKDKPHAQVPRPHFAAQPVVAVEPVAAVQRQAVRETADRIVAEERTRSASSETHAKAVRPFAPSPKHGPTLFGDSTSPQQDDELPSVTKIPLTRAAHVRPAFEVDQFAWPQICKTLSKKIGDQLDAIANSLARTPGGGSQIVGFAGVEHGVGCTTIALTVAHHLCQRKSVASDAAVLLIDADLEHSELATCLGLAPQACWNDTAHGSVPLEDTLIESLSDRMVVMPISAGVRKAMPNTLFSSALESDRTSPLVCRWR